MGWTTQRPEVNELNVLKLKEEALLKQSALRDLVNVLKKKQEETMNAQERYDKLIKDVADMERANKVIEEYKEKCERLEGNIKNIAIEYDQYKENIKKQLEENSMRYKETLSNYDDKIRELENKLLEKDECILELSTENKELMSECALNITYNIPAMDYIIDITEIYKLREENKNIGIKYTEAEKIVQRIHMREQWFNKEISEATQRHNEELRVKEEKIKELLEEKKRLEQEVEKMIECEKNWHKKMEKTVLVIQQKGDEIESIERNRSDMRNRIEILISQFKELQAQAQQKDALINNLKKTIGELEVTIGKKNKEINKLKGETSTFDDKLKDYRVKLSAAQGKVHDLGFTALASLRKDIQERDNTISSLKKTLKEYNNDIKVKNYIIMQLKQNVRPIRPIKELNLQNKRELTPLIPKVKAEDISEIKNNYVWKLENDNKPVKYRNDSSNMKKVLKFRSESLINKTKNILEGINAQEKKKIENTGLNLNFKELNIFSKE